MQPHAYGPRLAVLVVVATLVILACGPGIAAGGVATAETPVQPQQVGIDVSGFGGEISVGGDVDGNATVVAGRVGAAGQVGGNGTISLGATDFLVSASINASVGTGVGDVIDTATGQGQVEASVAGPERTYDFVRSATVPAFSPVPPDSRLTLQAPESGGTQLVILTAVTGGVLGPGQTETGDWFTLSFWDLYGFLVNLALGIVLVGVFPAFSRRVVAEVVNDPSRTGLFGIAVLVVTPIVLLLFALSLFGIPLALVGGLLFVVLLWIGAILGRYAVGAWLLAAIPRGLTALGVEQEPIENRVAALFVGLFVVGLLIHIPYVGRVVDVVVVALGVGAIGQIVLGTYRRTERAEKAEAVPVSGHGDD